MKKERRTQRPTAKKLELSGETIRTLHKGDLGQVVGGQPTSGSGSYCCTADF
jgi:hypothetical protein